MKYPGVTELSVEYLSTMIDSMVDAVFIVDRNLNIKMASRAAARLLGYGREFLIGKPYDMICAGKEGHCENVKMHYEEGSIWDIETFYRTKDGEEVPVVLAASPLKVGNGETGDILVVARDNTDYRNALEGLREERDMAQHYLNVAGVMLLALDTDGRVTLINKKGCEILGLEAREIVGKNWFDNFIPERLRGEIRTAFRKAMGGEIPLMDNYENPVVTGTGEERMIAWRNTIPTDGNGNITGVLSSGEDITERKTAEWTLLENQHMLVKEHEELHALFDKVEQGKREWEKTMDCLGDMIMITGDDEKIRRVNRTVSETFKMPYQDIIGRSWEDVLLEQGMESNTFYTGGIEIFQKATGKWYVINSYPFTSKDVGYSGAVITLHDTSEIKLVTEKLEETTKRIDRDREDLRIALDQISSLIQNVTLRKDYKAATFNPNLRKCYEVKGCTKKDCPCFGKGATRCWQIAGTFCGGKVQGAFAQKYGSCSKCCVFTGAMSDPIYQIGEQFNNMMHVLEVKNRETEKAYAELKATQAQLLQREKMASIGQLAAGVAHEINNPMGFISSNLGTLGKYMSRLTEFIGAQSEMMGSLHSAEASGKLAELRKGLKIDYILSDLEQLIKESLDGADRVKKIVQNLKSFSRVDEAEYKYADINECIESTLNIVWNELKYKATVTKEYGALPHTKCYPLQLNQVFVNLLINASQAIEKQGEIKIKTCNGDGSIKVSISDTGAGIAEDKIGRIFEPFYTTKEVGKGTGLGLSITYDIVKKHNGDISVESEVGKGTTFTVRIPVVEEK
ncbi:MAG: PAS domain S-box protein [Nitrospirae bacterium]|nr:PAS domain S-box protein [Nitrospirota bacterium]